MKVPLTILLNIDELIKKSIVVKTRTYLIVIKFMKTSTTILLAFMKLKVVTVVMKREANSILLTFMKKGRAFINLVVMKMERVEKGKAQNLARRSHQLRERPLTGCPSQVPLISQTVGAATHGLLKDFYPYGQTAKKPSLEFKSKSKRIQKKKAKVPQTVGRSQTRGSVLTFVRGPMLKKSEKDASVAIAS